MSVLLLNGFSSIWCIWRSSGLAGTALQCSHRKPRFPINSCRILSITAYGGLRYGVLFLYLGLVSPGPNCVGAGLRFLASDSFCRLSAVQTLFRFVSATASALALAFSRIFSIDSFECVRPLCSWPLTYLFQHLLDSFQRTFSPHPHSQNGAEDVGKTFKGDGLPRLLCPFTKERPGLTGSPHPQQQRLFGSFLFFMPTL